MLHDVFEIIRIVENRLIREIYHILIVLRNVGRKRTDSQRI